jgi:hypothetical protein
MLGDAIAISPRPDRDAVPDSARRMFRFQLGVMVSPFRDFRLVECKAIPNEPISEVDTVDGAGGDRGSTVPSPNGRAGDRAIGDERLELVRRLHPTLILDLIRLSAELAALGCVDAKQVDVNALNSKRVAIEDTGLSGNAIGGCRRCGKPCRNPECEHRPDRHVSPVKSRHRFFPGATPVCFPPA